MNFALASYTARRHINSNCGTRRSQMSKAQVTRTLGPIHFEDLDPHRFEDLVRELIYDFRDWHTIEATGRSGDDAGFDVRAFERVVADMMPEREEDDPPPVSQIGNLWMIQAKREKELGPMRIRDILRDIDPDSPPYGYVLAASANISRKGYDVFRSELRAKGVTESHLWGKGELEDMLLQPKNDRILFAFFGVSLVSRRRSRATDIRQIISTKNKLLRLLGEDSHGPVSILIRDIHDAHYPYRDKCPDFATRPRWKEYIVAEQHPRGVIVKLAEHFAFVDRVAKTFACDTSCNLARTTTESESHDPAWFEAREAAERQCQHLPARTQARFYRNGLIRYEDILVVDDKGDRAYPMPHLFVDLEPRGGPLSGKHEFAMGGGEYVPLHEFTVLTDWPGPKVEPGFGTIFTADAVGLTDSQRRMLHGNRDTVQTLFDVDGTLAVVKPRDVLTVPAISSRDSEPLFLEVTHLESSTIADYRARGPEQAWRLEEALGNTIAPEAALMVYECRMRYSFEVERHQTDRPSADL